MKTVVVTRHPSLVEHLKERGIIDESAEVIEHATENDVRGNHVIGILPVHLASLAGRYTNLTMNVPKELRGEELTIEQVREFAGEPVTYEVRVL